MKYETKNLITSRLVLRKFKPADADRVRQLAGDKAIARTTLSIPHPYKKGVADTWIKSLKKQTADKRNVVWAVTLKATKELIGSISLKDVNVRHQRAEIGYWIGRPYWNQGYATEAAQAVLHCGFTQLKLKRIFGHHFANNPASGRIMQKIGMQHEGTLRKHVKKWGCFIDLEIKGILHREWKQKNRRMKNDGSLRKVKGRNRVNKE
jgi:RimJ/RimL family protein N-acetyltransferase